MEKLFAGLHYQSLENAQLEDGTITNVESAAAGRFSLPDGREITGLPAFRRISANLKPSPDSDINVELWLPESNWNGRFLGTGNGGGGGTIAYDALAYGLLHGYATANTDMGTSPHANFMTGKPERWADFGYRSTHEMTVVSKKLIQIFYGEPAVFSYFTGCSTGGQQALMEAQRYPSDYNGIIAGVPANNRTHLHTSFLWNYKAANQVPGSAIPEKMIAHFTQAMLLQCRGRDGGAPGDNFLTDPRRSAGEHDVILEFIRKCDRLTKAQEAALKQIFAGPTNPRTGERIYTPFPHGSESSALGLDYQQSPAQMQDNFYPFRWAFGDDFDYTKFDFDYDLDTLDEILAPLLNANNPDLSVMKELGGKIIMFSGSADPLVPFQDALNYYERVVQAQQGMEQTQDFFRYYLVPGMGHYRGGSPGLNHIGLNSVSSVPWDSEHDILPALVEWVEKGKAPDRIIATAFKLDASSDEISFQRPIYPYPMFPEYIGGDPGISSSYQGIDHPRGDVLRPADRYL